MTYIPKPKVHHPALQKNAVGLTRRDYEGSITTLCAGCGHDSVTAAIVQAFWELAIPPHRVAKLSGIGCSSKTPAYFLRDAHGFNGVHGRMPALATGANAANGDLIFIGISGDGDSLSIGLGQMSHAIRRNVNLLYILENNGVYGLTKGQFSAAADKGSTSKKGEANSMEPIDGALLALTLGATFVARTFSGDKAQLVPILKAGLTHKGFAFVDVISPCVTFNDHEGSTKSYAYTREHNVEIVAADFVPPTSAITADYESGTLRKVMMHDGSWVTLRKMAEDYDPTDRDRSYQFIREAQGKGEVVTGLLYISPDSADMHEQSGTVEAPLDRPALRAAVPGRRRAAGAAAALPLSGLTAASDDVPSAGAARAHRRPARAGGRRRHPRRVPRRRRGAHLARGAGAGAAVHRRSTPCWAAPPTPRPTSPAWAGAPRWSGLVGNDAAGDAVRPAVRRRAGCQLEALSDGRETTRKVRVVSRQQQLLRIDYETTADIDASCRARLMRRWCGRSSVSRHRGGLRLRQGAADQGRVGRRPYRGRRRRGARSWSIRARGTRRPTPAATT